MKKNKTMLELAHLFTEEHPLTLIKESFELAASARALADIANGVLSKKPEFLAREIDSETLNQTLATSRANAAAAVATIESLRMLDAIGLIDDDDDDKAADTEEEKRGAAVDAAWRFARCVMNDRAVGGPTEEQ